MEEQISQCFETRFKQHLLILVLVSTITVGGGGGAVSFLMDGSNNCENVEGDLLYAALTVATRQV